MVALNLHRLIWGVLFVAASATASDRFMLVMGDAAVVDNKTGLVWGQSLVSSIWDGRMLQTIVAEERRAAGKNGGYRPGTS